MEGAVFVIGAGAAGGSLAVSLARGGVSLAGVCDSRGERAGEIAAAAGRVPAFTEPPAGAGGASIVIVAVPDDAVTGLARDVASRGVPRTDQVWLHLSGALPVAALDPLAGLVRDLGSFHPAHVFAPGRVTPLPPGVSYAVSGGDGAVAAGRDLAAALGGAPVVLSDADRTRYHAATVLASNYLVALLAEARELLVGEGLAADEADRLLASLATSAVDRVREIGIDASLSGPIRRGDRGTVEAHLAALESAPRALEIYEVLGRAAGRLAARIGETDPALLAAIEALFER
jgi:predicted short-subunit dehydrogenase-like oxidoreductase (DUF2520 family)